MLETFEITVLEYHHGKNGDVLCTFFHQKTELEKTAEKHIIIDKILG
jgi:hypothetical protein